MLAYFIHLSLDGFWFELVARASKRDYYDLIEEKGDDAWWIMKDDWYALDVQHVAENEDSLFWTEIMPLEDFPT